MRAMDALTQNLIDSLTQILSKESVEVSLATLQVCAPILIEHLQMVKKSAVDRRDVESQLNATPTLIVTDNRSQQSIKLLGAMTGDMLLSAIDWLDSQSVENLH